MENMLKLSERILEDFPRGGQHEKVFRGILAFWFCVIAVLLIFIVKYRVTPPEFQVVSAEYIDNAVDEYYVNALYKIDVTVKGWFSEEDLDQFTETAKNEYKDEFKDSHYLIIYFYDKYQIDETTGEPDRKPLAERKIYEDDSWRTVR